MPSFDEIWPQAGKGRPGDARRKRMGMEYILEVGGEMLFLLLQILLLLLLQAMQHHGLGHLPQPDNFTTCGRLGIEINQVQIIEIFLHEVADIFASQYNNPVECYADDTIEEMRDEKIILDHPEIAEKILKGNAQVIFLKIT